MPSKGADEKYCESCGEIVKKEAEICPNCGVRVSRRSTSTGTFGSEDYYNEGMFMFPIKYPLSQGWGPIILGSLMAVLSFLILPIVILYGYGYRLGRAAARGDQTGPDFDDWGGLLKDGFLMIVAFVPYGIGVLVIFGGLVGIAVTLEQQAVTIAIAVVGFILYLVAAYAGGAIIPAFVGTGSVTGTYAGGRFLKIAFTKDFFVGFLVYIALNIVVQTVFTIVVSVLFFTVVGIVIALPLSIAIAPYMLYLTTSLWGYVVWDSDDPAFPTVDSTDRLGAEF